MNFTKLYKAQKKLDDHIVKEKGLQGVDLLDKKILALLAELGELLNEWRGFKFWSEDLEPRTEFECYLCNGLEEIHANTFDYDIESIDIPCPACNGGDHDNNNPLLEEYADCLSFILSIGSDQGYENVKLTFYDQPTGDATDYFNVLFDGFSRFLRTTTRQLYKDLFSLFRQLGQLFGFTTDQIEQAYFEKNKINFERQKNGY